MVKNGSSLAVSERLKYLQADKLIEGTGLALNVPECGDKRKTIL